MIDADQEQPFSALPNGDLAPDKLTLGVLHRVLQRLLNVDVPSRDLVQILEAIAETAEGPMPALGNTGEAA